MSEDDGRGAPWWALARDASGPAPAPKGAVIPTGTGWPPAQTPPSSVPRAPAPVGPGLLAYGGAAAADVVPADPAVDSRRRARRRLALLAGGLAIALVAGGLGGVLGAWLSDEARASGRSVVLGPTPATSTQRPPESVAGIAARVLPSVVSITVRAGGSGGTGSGFVIAADGYVLTNNHVVSAAAGGSGTITVELADGRSERAQIVGRSQDYDLAVLKVGLRELPAVSLGDSDSVVVGDAVVAIGSPLGLAGTVTTGIISAQDRPVIAGEEADSQSYINALQTDAAINPGNSGGPLVDGDGRVVGVNSAIASLGGQNGIGQLPTGSIGLGFAIPINQARDVAQQLIDDGSVRYPVIGVSLDRRYDGAGAKIFDGPTGAGPAVVPDGPSARAGLRAGDVIVRFDGRRIASGPELVVAIRTHRPGDVVTLGYVRGGGPVKTVTVTLGGATERLSR